MGRAPSHALSHRTSEADHSFATDNEACAAPKKYSKNKFYHNIVADSLPAAGTCHDRGHSSMTSVPATIKTRPRADFFVSFSWKTR